MNEIEKEVEEILDDCLKEIGFEEEKDVIYSKYICKKPLTPKLLTLINKCEQSVLKKIKSEVEQILTPHEYESDNSEMENFACKLKDKYKMEIIKSIDDYRQSYLSEKGKKWIS
jgi:hypothetical protein